MGLRKPVRVIRAPRRAQAVAMLAPRLGLGSLWEVLRAGFAGRTWRVLWGDWSDSALFSAAGTNATRTKEERGK